MSDSFIQEYEMWFLKKHGYLPEQAIDENEQLRQRVAELEAELAHRQDKGAEPNFDALEVRR